MEIGSAYDRSGGHTERRLSYRIQEADGPGELVPDLMLPVQFIELLQRPSERTPELRLMAAVLEDAIRTFCRCAASQTARSRRLFEETAEWFDTSDVSWPFSFENICDALGLEAEWIRRLLRRCRGSRTSTTHGMANIPSVRRIAGSRHSISGRAPGLRHASRFAS